MKSVRLVYAGVFLSISGIALMVSCTKEKATAPAGQDDFSKVAIVEPIKGETGKYLSCPPGNGPCTCPSGSGNCLGEVVITSNHFSGFMNAVYTATASAYLYANTSFCNQLLGSNAVAPQYINGLMNGTYSIVVGDARSTSTVYYIGTGSVSAQNYIVELVLNK